MILLWLACTGAPEPAADPVPPVAQAVAVPGVQGTTVRAGALLDTSGPWGISGRQWSDGLRLLQADVNDGGILPEPWQLDVVIRDHSYNPMNAVTAYGRDHADVLWFMAVQGTPNTLPLLPLIERDQVPVVPTEGVAHGPPLVLTPLQDAVAAALGPDAASVAVVAQPDDSGAAARAGAQSVTTPVAEVEVSWSMDAAAVVAELSAAGARTVVVSVSPKQLVELLAAADAGGLDATWICPARGWLSDVRAQLSDDQLARVRVVHVTPTADQSPHDLHTLADLHRIELTDIAARAYWSGWVQLQGVAAALSDGAIDRAELADQLAQPAALPALPTGVQVLVPTRQGWAAP